MQKGVRGLAWRLGATSFRVLWGFRFRVSRVVETLEGLA